MKNTNNSDVGFYVGITIFAFSIYGYIANAASLIQADAMTGMEVARAIGIFVVPVGVVLGYF